MDVFMTKSAIFVVFSFFILLFYFYVYVYLGLVDSVAVNFKTEERGL